MTEESKAKIMALLEEHRACGFDFGYQRRLVDMICIKLRKGKWIAEISEELEVEPDEIALVCVMATHYAPDYDSEQVFKWANLLLCKRIEET